MAKMTKMTLNGKEISPEDVLLPEKVLELIANCLD